MRRSFDILAHKAGAALHDGERGAHCLGGLLAAEHHLCAPSVHRASPPTRTRLRRVGGYLAEQRFVARESIERQREQRRQIDPLRAHVSAARQAESGAT